jgi:hypothetical protein
MKVLKSGYINYFLADSSTAGIRVASFKNIDPQNAYTLKHRRFISNAVNLMVGTFVYWSDRYNRPQNTIIMTDNYLAKSIGCSVDHAFRLMNRIEELFSMDFTRAKYHGGSRTIKLNKTFIDFLKIYTEEEYQAFINTHNITEDDKLYALRQVYEYRIWGLTDSQLSPSQRAAKKVFIDDMKDHLHYVATSNKSDLKRIELIQKHSQKLSELQQGQLQKIKEALKLGKLFRYLHKVLIRLEQKILLQLYFDKQDKEETTEDNNSRINGNQTPGENVAAASATKAAQKKPDDADGFAPRDYIVFMSLWNEVSQDKSVPRLEMLTEQRKQSIERLVKIHSKEDLFKAVKNIRHLYHDISTYKTAMTFNRFIEDETFLMILESNSFDPRLGERDWLDGINDLTRFKNIEHSVPEFDNYEQAMSYWKQNK